MTIEIERSEFRVKALDCTTGSGWRLSYRKNAMPNSIAHAVRIPDQTGIRNASAEMTAQIDNMTKTAPTQSIFRSILLCSSWIRGVRARTTTAIGARSQNTHSHGRSFEATTSPSNAPVTEPREKKLVTSPTCQRRWVSLYSAVAKAIVQLKVRAAPRPGETRRRSKEEKPGCQ